MAALSVLLLVGLGATHSVGATLGSGHFAGSEYGIEDDTLHFSLLQVEVRPGRNVTPVSSHREYALYDVALASTSSNRRFPKEGVGADITSMWHNVLMSIASAFALGTLVGWLLYFYYAANFLWQKQFASAKDASHLYPAQRLLASGGERIPPLDRNDSGSEWFEAESDGEEAHKEAAVDKALVQRFEKAVISLEARGKAGKLNNVSHQKLLEVDGLFNQAKVGSGPGVRPAAWSIKARTKWNAWAAVRDFSRSQAMRRYIGEVDRLSST